MNEQAAVLSSDSPLATEVRRLAATVTASHYPTGDRAALRRWAPGQPVPLAFYRLWLRHMRSDLPPESQTNAWIALAWSIATLGAGGHVPQRSLGQALAESGFSEGRLERLLSAPEEVHLELFMSAVRLLAAKGKGFDLLDAARFLLTTDAAKREGIYRRIAEGFYRYLPKNN
jgi:CRISPR system Cascade subunit CasB